MILPITIYGNPILRKKGAKIESITPEINQLIDDMLETMYDAEGVGLAAQQIGHALQLTVIDVAGITERPSRMWINDKEVDLEAHMPMVLINPEISTTKKKEVGPEGCLSFPEILGDISRGFRVKVNALDRQGNPLVFEAAGLLGRAVQHEVDHLNGILFIDHMAQHHRTSIKYQLEEIKEAGIKQSEATSD